MRARGPFLILGLLLLPGLVTGCARKLAEEERARAEEKEASKYMPPEDGEPTAAAATDPYADMSEEERIEKAKGLFGEAEDLAHEEKWAEAEAKYEEAYHLVPGKHGFAFKVGTAAFSAGHCQKAEQYLQHFKAYADEKKQKARLKEADAILAKTAECSGG